MFFECWAREELRAMLYRHTIEISLWLTLLHPHIHHKTAKQLKFVQERNLRTCFHWILHGCRFLHLVLAFCSLLDIGSVLENAFTFLLHGHALPLMRFVVLFELLLAKALWVVATSAFEFPAVLDALVHRWIAFMPYTPHIVFWKSCCSVCFFWAWKRKQTMCSHIRLGTKLSQHRDLLFLVRRCARPLFGNTCRFSTAHGIKLYAQHKGLFAARLKSRSLFVNTLQFTITHT